MFDISETTVRAWRRRFSLYGPALFGIGVMGVGAAQIVGVTTLRLEEVLIVTGAMLTVLSLHRAHEYRYGFSDWENPIWPSITYAGSFALFLIAFQFGWIIVAVVGGVLAIGTAYIQSRSDK